MKHLSAYSGLGSRTLLATAVALASQAGYAQGLLEEVVVTAQKREQSLQEVPIAITAFTEQTIRRAGIERPADFIHFFSKGGAEVGFGSVIFKKQF